LGCIPKNLVQSLDLSACSVIEIEARVFCARGIVVGTVEHHMVDRLKGKSTFARKGNSALCMESLGVLACEGEFRKKAE
jgi:hypothetical protein